MLLVGTAGVPTYCESNLEGIAEIPKIGLGCMEVEFTYGVKMGAELAEEIGRKSTIQLSVHAPYYINLNSKEAKKIVDSENRILLSAERGSQMRAKDIVFHPGFYSGKSPEVAYQNMHIEMSDLVEVVVEKGWGVRLAPETTGKASQFGSYQELVSLCKEIDGLSFTLDFSHVWARSLGDVMPAEVLAYVRKELGPKFMRDMHMHFSGVEFTKAGERRHQTIAESKFPFTEMVAALKKYKVGGTIICESPNQEADAILLRDAL